MNLSSTHVHLDSRLSQQYQRLWWSLYVRDKTLALELREPGVVEDARCKIPTPSRDCLELRPLRDSSIASFPALRPFQKAEYQEHIATIFLSRLKLCTYISRIWRVAHQISAPPFDDDDDDSTVLPRMFVPKSADDFGRSTFHEVSLDSWWYNLPREARFSPKFPLPTSGEEEQVLAFHRSLLAMQYFSISNALHPISRGELQSPSPLAASAMSRLKVETNLIIFFDIVKHLAAHDCAKFAPTLGLHLLLHAASTYVVLMKAVENGLPSCVDRFQSMAVTLDILLRNPCQRAAMQEEIRKLEKEIQRLKRCMNNTLLELKPPIMPPPEETISPFASDEFDPSNECVDPDDLMQERNVKDTWLPETPE